MDGFAVAEKLREEECCHDTIFVAVSGYGQDEDRRRSSEAGFHHHLLKPTEFEAVLALLTKRPV